MMKYELRECTRKEFEMKKKKTKFEKVKEALQEKTRETSSWLTLSKNTDMRHSGKYVPVNMFSQKPGRISFKTLDEVIAEYDLKI